MAMTLPILKLVCMTALLVMALGSDLCAQSRTSGGATGGATTGRATGQTGAGGTGAQSGQATFNMQAGTSASVNREFGSEMVGMSDSTGFVGNAQAGQQVLRNNNPNFQQRNSASRIASLNNNNKRVDVRGTVSLGFETPSRTGAMAVATISNRVSSLTRSTRFESDLAVNVGENGIAQVSGTVSDPQAQKLLEMYLLLEPGVKKVDNQTQTRPYSE